MRRMIGGAALLAVASACASPPVGLDLKFTEGQERVYRMTTLARTAIDVPGLGDDETTELHATLRIAILSATAGGANVRVTMTPNSFRRAGRSSEPPLEQSATLTVDAHGDVIKVETVTGATAPLGGSPDDLGALLGAPGRRGRVRVGDRWRTTLRGSGGGTGSRSSRVASLRFVADRRCAIIESSSTRPVTRERTTQAGSLRLSGIESSTTTAAFAFDLGYPIHITSDAHGRFSVAGSQSGEGVGIASTTTLDLISTGPITEKPAQSPGPTATKKPAATVKPSVKATPTTSGSPSR